jgi:hypothetical protein
MHRSICRGRTDHWPLRIRWLIDTGAFTKTLDSFDMRDCFSSYSRDDSFRSSICACQSQRRTTKSTNGEFTLVKGGPIVVIRKPSRPCIALAILHYVRRNCILLTHLKSVRSHDSIWTAMIPNLVLDHSSRDAEAGHKVRIGSTHDYGKSIWLEECG